MSDLFDAILRIRCSLDLSYNVRHVIRQMLRNIGLKAFL
jgi:hypothetical protein